VQSSIYSSQEDSYLIEKLEEKAKRERKSMSACLLTILEDYFEAGSRIGKILTDMDLLDRRDLVECLDKQEKEGSSRKIGEVLVEAGFVKKVDLDRALMIQKPQEKSVTGSIVQNRRR